MIQALCPQLLASTFRRVGVIGPKPSGARHGVVVVADESEYWLQLERDLPVPDDIVVLDDLTALDERRKGLVAGGSLSNKKVGIVGAGSLGSPIAMLLAQAGVGTIPVIDCDVVDVSNVSRHVLDYSDVGRSKAIALSERLRLRGIRSSAHNLDVTKADPTHLLELLGGCDLVVSTVDVPSASFLLNELIVDRGTTGLFAGAYELASAGEIIVVRPGKGHCLYCAVGFRTAIAPAMNLRQRRQAYRNADAERMIAEPGLAVDITYLATVAAAEALAILDPDGNRAALLGDGFSLVHGPSTPSVDGTGIFQGPMDFVQASVARPEPCPVCGFAAKEAS